MTNKIQYYTQIADDTAKQITGSYQNWTSFLKTVGRLYKYPYNEQLMIYAQRPDAIACADFDFWNQQWGRYVRRGSKGIALIDTSGENPRLRYVFDVADTGTRENSRAVRLWELHEEHSDVIRDMLERSYGISGEYGMRDQLKGVAEQLADEYWNEHRRDILDNLADSFLEGYHALNNIERSENQKKRLRENWNFWRGDIYLADLGFGMNSLNGSYVPGGIRPVVLLQSNVGNFFSTALIIVPITCKSWRSSKKPTQYEIQQARGIPGNCIARGEQITVIDKRQCIKYLGKVSQEDADAIKDASLYGLSDEIDIPEVMEAP